MTTHPPPTSTTKHWTDDRIANALRRIQVQSRSGSHQTPVPADFECFEVHATRDQVTVYARSLPSLPWLTRAFLAEGLKLVRSGTVRELPYVIVKLGWK